MPYSSTVTATKPSDAAVWFNKANPTVSKAEIDWIKSQPGFVSLTVKNLNANTLESTLVFKDQASFAAMQAARENRSDYQARQAYLAANGITRSITRA